MMNFNKNTLVASLRRQSEQLKDPNNDGGDY